MKRTLSLLILTAACNTVDVGRGAGSVNPVVPRRLVESLPIPAPPIAEIATRPKRSDSFSSALP